LEASLQKLKAHTWGTSHEALLEALSMERGQQELSNEERVLLIQDIIKQQREQVEFLRETQREQQVLLSLVENPDSELSQELQSILNLSDSQKEDIRISCQGLDKEVEAMETFIQCLDAMKDKSWLLNEGVAQIANQFTSILHPNQLSKFLLWADTNAEALDTLEYCHAPPSQAPPANFPIFVFGMDDHGSHATGNGEE
jgi:tRNA U34 5-carboxymethylaminomethyl modifying GTPase MnmE/TrmE